MSDENAILEQHKLVQAFKSAREKKLLRNTKDIRDEIAKGAHYEPKDDMPYEYQAYPKWVTPKDGEPRIVNSKAEHDALLGIEPTPAKKTTVDVSSLVQTPAPERVRRAYTKRTQQPLPAALE